MRMTSSDPTLAAFTTEWERYQNLLSQALAPLTADQLALRAAPHLRSIGELATHIAATRAGWFRRAINEGGPEFDEIRAWQEPGMPPRTSAELVDGLRRTWDLIQTSLARWTPDEFVAPFTRQRGTAEVTLTRRWIIWHLIEHDLHHGGELAFTLGMHHLPAPVL
jgi:uncharacterized damage-inducible protein DinB